LRERRRHLPRELSANTGFAQHRGDIASVGVAGIALAQAYLLEHSLLDWLHHLAVVAVAGEAAGAGCGQQVEPAWVVHPVGQLAKRGAQVPQAVGFHWAEDDAHDRL
jgi:hypothetical protein